MLYPTVSDYWNSFHQSRAIAGYAESISLLTAADYERIWQEACEDNQDLLQRNERYALSEAEQAQYEAQLNPLGNGIMGYIEIPKINTALPIYHGTDETILQVAVGHVDISSLPVGGPSSHCVLSGHRGLPSASLFTHLDRLETGDVFMLQILNETLTYEVDQIHIVLPEEVEDLDIEEGRDYCTLVTCTPYGINTHRLLVRGVRIENLLTSAHITSDAILIDPILVAPLMAVPMLLLLLAWLIISTSRKKK